MNVPIPANEDARLRRLQEYRILDTDPEKRFDDLAFLASYICQTPVAMISLIDSDRQWMKSVVGYPPLVLQRDISFCAHTILEPEMLVVEDATRDERFSKNPLVAQAPSVRFYAGVPIFSYDGLALGSLCVLDRTPRTLSNEQLEALKSLSRQVHDQLELRRNLLELKDALKEQKRSQILVQESEDRFRKILETSRDGILVEKDEHIVFMNTAYAKLFGCESPDELMGLHISELAAPEDLERLLEYGRIRARKEAAPNFYEFKIKRRNTGVLVELDASVSDFFQDNNNHYIITFVRDISERKKNERERERLIAELQEALTNVKTLSGLLPICSSCKKIRDDKGYWNRLETYIETRTEVDFTHGICPDCARKLYPEDFEEK
jgi:PAS domain S-box-containing protein